MFQKDSSVAARLLSACSSGEQCEGLRQGWCGDKRREKGRESRSGQVFRGSTDRLLWLVPRGKWERLGSRWAGLGLGLLGGWTLVLSSYDREYGRERRLTWGMAVGETRWVLLLTFWVRGALGHQVALTVTLWGLDAQERFQLEIQGSQSCGRELKTRDGMRFCEVSCFCWFIPGISLYKIEYYEQNIYFKYRI